MKQPRVLEIDLGSLIPSKRKVAKPPPVFGEGGRILRWLGIVQPTILPDTIMQSKYTVSTYLCVNSSNSPRDSSPRKFKNHLVRIVDEFCSLTDRRFFLKTNEACYGFFFSGPPLLAHEQDALTTLLERELVQFSVFDCNKGLPPSLTEEEFEHFDSDVVLMVDSYPLDIFAQCFDIH